MSYLTADQFVAAQKANLEILFGLNETAFEGAEKLFDLNVKTAKAAFAESADHARSVMAVKDVQELFALQQGLVQPSAEKALSYGRHVYEIAAATQAAFVAAAETQVADVQKQFTQIVDVAVKNAPAGSENAVALVKSAVAAANNAYETVQKAAKQAAGVAEANLKAVVSQAAKAPAARAKR